MPEWHFFNYFLKNKVLKNLTLIPPRSEGGGVGWDEGAYGGAQPSFSQKCGAGKLNQTDV